MTDNTNLCMNCMGDTQGNQICPNCGWNTQEPQMRFALPYGAMLQGRYIVGRAKKANGEGITYIGRDTVQNTIVEIREFFPQSFCQRQPDGYSVLASGGNEILFDESLTMFLGYARELAHMRELSAIVCVFDIFEENQTAYTVSEWTESITLRYFVERSGGSLSWNAARQLFMPVLSALSTMNEAGLHHFGISPESLKIMQDGKMRLGDFCIAPVRRMDTDFPPDIVAGCAAIEQYSAVTEMDEATDVYGFAASLFFALTGELPQDAVYRKNDSRLLIPTELAKALPPHVVTALANALQVEPERRTKNFERLRAELSAAPTVTSQLEGQTGSITKLPPLPKKKDDGLPGFIWLLVSCAISLVVMAVIVWIWFQVQPPVMSQEEESGISSSASATPDPSSLTEEDSDSSLVSESSVELIDVPNLVDQNYQELQEKVSASEDPDYVILLSGNAFSTTVEEGNVVSQEPAPGEQMERGGAIVVIVSQGKPTRELPDIKGLTLAQAAERVTSEGFVPVTEKVYSEEIDAGKVVGYKDYVAGQSLSYGSEVVLLVSDGKDPASDRSSDITE